MTVAPKEPIVSTARTETPDLSHLLGISQKKNARGKWVRRLLLLVVLLAALGGYYSYSSRESKTVYTTQKTTRGDLTVKVTATGSVEPTESVDVSSEQSGTVREVNVNYNSPVKQGDVILTLDTVKLEADLKSAQAKLNSSKATVLKSVAELASAEISLERQKSLIKSGVAKQQDVDTAQYTYDAAIATKQINEADVLSSEANLQLAQTNLDKARIISPITGIVLSRDVDPGATVAASLSAPVLFTIAGDLRKMELQVDVDEADVGQVAVGQEATFTVDAFPTMKFPAKISMIRYVSQTVSNVVTYMAILTVENDKLLLRPGMTATADIIVKSIRDAVLIPNAALRYAPPVVNEGSSGMFSLFKPPRMGALTAPEPTGTKRNVWILRDGQPSVVTVEIGESDGQNTALVSGSLAEGDALITDSTTAAK